MPRAVTVYIFSQGLIYNSVLSCEKIEQSGRIFLQIYALLRI